MMSHLRHLHLMILVIWTLFMLLMELVLAAKSTVERIYDNFFGDGSFCNS